MTPRRSVEVVLHALERVDLDVRSSVGLDRGTGDVDDATYDAIWSEARRRGLRHADLLKMARHYVVGAAGPHDLAAFAEPTVEAALRALARQWPRISGSRDTISVVARGERLEVRFLHASADAEDPWTDTFIVAAIFDRLRTHARTRLRPLQIALTLVPDITERAAFDAFFEAERGVRFGVAACGFTLHLRDGRAKLLTGDAVAARRLADATGEAKAGVSGAVRGEIRRWLARGAALEDVARSLGVHPRTLQRQLRLVGTSYREQREHTALAEARWMLAESTEPLGAIGERVGFADQPSFTRAFSRVLGMPPGAFRELMRPRGEPGDRAVSSSSSRRPPRQA